MTGEVHTVTKRRPGRIPPRSISTCAAEPVACHPCAGVSRLNNHGQHVANFRELANVAAQNVIERVPDLIVRALVGVREEFNSQNVPPRKETVRGGDNNRKIVVSEQLS